MSKTILIVEDDRALVRMWTDLLASEGFDVLAEQDGEWALKTATSRTVDFILLDVLIPMKNGFQVAERLRQTTAGRQIPILMVSGIYRSSHHRRRAMEKYGLVAYLDKPIRNEELLSILKKHFGTDYPSRDAAQKQRARVEQRPAEDFATEDSRREVAEVEKSSRQDFRGAKVGRGDLRKRTFPELLAELYRWKATGALLVKRGRAKKIVYFKDGYPISVKSNTLAECLGKVMVRERMITEKQCEESLELMRLSGRQQGTVLIEMGLISPHNLVFALELQLITKLVDLFSWRNGTYQFTSHTDLPANTVSLEMTPAALIWQGVQDQWPSDRARSALGRVEDHFVVPATDPLYRYQEMELNPDQEALFRKVDGKRTVSDLLALELIPEDDVWKLVYALSAAQMVEVRPTPLRRGEHIPAVKPPSLPKRPPPLPAGKEAAPALLPEVAGLGSHSAGAPSARRQAKEGLLARLKEMRRQSHYEVLGVARSASPSEIRKAYFALAREFHPDKLSGAMGDELKQLSGEVYDLITAAYDTLADSGERKAYDTQLASGARKKEMSDQVSKILAAEGKFQRGEGFLRRGEWGLAREAFQEAVDLYPEEGEFHAFLGWSLFQTNPGDAKTRDSALDHIMRAIQLNPQVDKAYLFLGYLYKSIGRADKAERQFEKAIQCNPDCTEALRELRLSQGRAR